MRRSVVQTAREGPHARAGIEDFGDALVTKGKGAGERAASQIGADLPVHHVGQVGKLGWYTAISGEKRAVEITSGYGNRPNDGVRFGYQFDVGTSTQLRFLFRM